MLHKENAGRPWTDRSAQFAETAVTSCSKLTCRISVLQAGRQQESDSFEGGKKCCRESLLAYLGQHRNGVLLHSLSPTAVASAAAF